MHSPAFLSPSPLISNPSAHFNPSITLHPPTRSHRRAPLAVANKPSTDTSVAPTSTHAPTSTTNSSFRWAGDGFFPALVTGIINLPVIKPLMRYAARSVLISTAERTGIPWRSMVADLNKVLPKNSDQRRIALDNATNPQITLPSYLEVPIHAYPEANHGWLPAFEALPATMSMAVRMFPDKTPDVANHALRKLFLDRLMEFTPPGFFLKPQFTLVDLASGIGVSTRHMVSRIMDERGTDLPLPEVKALDASQYFVVVAKMLQKEIDANSISPVVNIDYQHVLAEDTGLENESVDLISLQLLMHELPDYAAKDILQEAFRVMRPGGVLAIMDQDPFSQTIRNLPPVLIALMKSTEPFMDQFYARDMEQLVVDAGFVDVKNGNTTHRHRCFVATKP